MMRIASEIIGDDANEFRLMLLHFESEDKEITGEDTSEEKLTQKGGEAHLLFK
jgi:hypothetical protein